MSGFLKKVGRTLGKGLQIASPVLAMTGVGAPLAAAAMAGGRVLDKATSEGGLGKAKLFKDILLPTAAAGAGGAAVKSAGGAGSLLDQLKARMLGHGPTRVAETLNGTPIGIGGEKGFLGKIGELLRKKPELALGALGAFQKSRQQGKAANLADQAAQMAQQSAADMAPLRAALMARLAQPQQQTGAVATPQASAPDISALIAAMPKPQQFSFGGR